MTVLGDGEPPPDPAASEGRAWRRTRRTVFGIFCELLIALAILGSIQVIRYVADGVVFFRHIPYLELPAEYIFDGGHVALLIFFLYRSVRVFVRESNE